MASLGGYKAMMRAVRMAALAVKALVAVSRSLEKFKCGQQPLSLNDAHSKSAGRTGRSGLERKAN